MDRISTITPGAAQAIAHHNHEADQAHRKNARDGSPWTIQTDAEKARHS